MKNIAAIIPAAGYSSRLGFLKSLLPISSSLVVERSIQTFQRAGVEDIRVVTGYKADLLVPILTRLGVKAIVNPNYDRGMYSSIQAGVRPLDNNVEAFFLLPADYAFVSADTIRNMLSVYESNKFEVIHPVFHNKRGHPPLIAAMLRDRILAAEPEGGLKELLEMEAHAAEVRINDEGILMDLDSEEDYRKVSRDFISPYPTRKECLEILKEHRVPAPVLEHVQAVAGVSCRIAEHLNSRGYRLHPGILMAAALLHDIVRGENDHAKKGSQLIARLGYPEIADIIAFHMELDSRHQYQISETTILYLADKLVSGHRLISLNERREERLNQFSDEAAQQAAGERIGQAIAIQQRIESILGSKLTSILDEKVVVGNTR